MAITSRRMGLSEGTRVSGERKNKISDADAIIQQQLTNGGRKPWNEDFFSRLPIIVQTVLGLIVQRPSVQVLVDIRRLGPTPYRRRKVRTVHWLENCKNCNNCGIRTFFLVLGLRCLNFDQPSPLQSPFAMTVSRFFVQLKQTLHSILKRLWTLPRSRQGPASRFPDVRPSEDYIRTPLKGDYEEGFSPESWYATGGGSFEDANGVIKALSSIHQHSHVAITTEFSFSTENDQENSAVFAPPNTPLPSPLIFAAVDPSDEPVVVTVV
ncbi:unnamed protein product [Somion occarium]|uniref:Uncharacterized protein n=1 Tax=Somion occarium TaxID=3059160 RepID=A0ABP1DSR3_9APHY